MSNKNNGMPDIRGVEAFVAVMASGSMTAAAKQMGIGQPTITRLVRDLEIAIGFAVFERNGPRISPTSRGTHFFTDAQRLLASYKQVADRAAALRDTQTRSVTFAASPTMAAGILPSMLSAISDDCPASLSVATLNAENLAQALQSGEADYGVCALPLSHAGLDCLVTSTSHLVAVLAEDHPARSISLEVFRDTRLLTLGNSYRIRHKIDVLLSEMGIEPIAELSTNSSLNAILAARAGVGIAVVDPVSAYGIGIEGIKVVPLEQDIPYEWGLFRRTGQDTSFDVALIDGFQTANAGILAHRQA